MSNTTVNWRGRVASSARNAAIVLTLFFVGSSLMILDVVSRKVDQMTVHMQRAQLDQLIDNQAHLIATELHQLAELAQLSDTTQSLENSRLRVRDLMSQIKSIDYDHVAVLSPSKSQNANIDPVLLSFLSRLTDVVALARGSEEGLEYAIRYVGNELRLIVAVPTSQNFGQVLLATQTLSPERVAGYGETISAQNFVFTPEHFNPEDLDPSQHAHGLHNGPLVPTVDAVWVSSLNRFERLKDLGSVFMMIFVGLAALMLFLGMGVMRILGELSKAERRSAHLAHHDALTGLPNRAKFDKLFEKSMDHVDVGSFALMAIDLDHFKLANDTYGHAAGDEVLQVVSQRLQNIITPVGTLARIGGDEFMAIITDYTDEHALRLLGDHLIEASSEPVIYNDQYISVSASVGVALAPLNGRTMASLTRSADEALYSAKDSGRGVVRFKSTANYGRRSDDFSTHSGTA